MSTDSVFAVFFSLQKSSTRLADRIVLLRRFTQDGLGAGIKILDDAVLQGNRKYISIMLLQASSADLIKTALKPCEGIYDIVVSPVDSLEHNDTVTNACFCIFSYDGYSSKSPVPQLPEAVQVRSFAKLPCGSPCSSLCIVQAATFGQAQRYGLVQNPGRYVYTMYISTAADYFNSNFNTEKQHSVEEETAIAPVLNVDAGYVLRNDNSDQQARIIYQDVIADVTKDFTAAFNNIQVIFPGQSARLQSYAYAWVNPKPYDFIYEVVYNQGGEPGMNSFIDRKDFSYGSPSAIIPYAEGLTISASLNDYGKITHQVVTPLYTWMDTLFNSNTYDAPWLEDSYEKGEEEAYLYIVDNIPGKVQPKNGTIKEKSYIVEYPGPGVGAFTEEEFNTVRDHLLQEIDHFKTVDTWFYPNGIFDAIINFVANASSNDLLAAANLMSIEHTSMMTMILDDVFSALTSIISLIPEVGPAIAAVVAVTWSAVKIGIHSQQGGTSLQSAVADMADKLNSYTQAAVNNIQSQKNSLYNNWGRLSQFSLGIVDGILSENQFFPSGNAVSGNANDPYQKPQGFIEAASHAWMLEIYKSLFAISHRPKSTLSLSTNKPANPWNPDNNNYEYTWYLPGVYLDSKGNQVTGYLVMDCNTDAPAEVKQLLFGTASAFNVPAAAFFIGFDGWPRIVPSHLNDVDHITTPIVSIG